MKNPFFIQDQPGGFQTNGWLDAWDAAVSPLAVAAESAADIAAAVRFAAAHGVRLVVKGAGHDYLGRNCAPDSLLVWTHAMRDVRFHDAFTPQGAPAGTAPRAALSVGAGTRWLEAYQGAAAHGHYVQGGGCTTVGAAGGFIQGGGFGSFSKTFGTGAGGVLEYEVVTAAGEIVIANTHRNADLFFALRGGGGGTFGIVSRVTLLAHPMPTRMGLVEGTIAAPDDAAFGRLIARLLRFYREVLDSPPWGEQIAIAPDNTITFFMTILDLDAETARAAWQPFLDDVAAAGFSVEKAFTFRTHPFARFFDPDYWDSVEPGFVRRDTRPGAAPDHYWWATNGGEVAEYLYTYQSRWIPAAQLAPDGADALADALYRASRHATVRLQINKGLSGAPPEVLARERETSVNPVAHGAAMIAILAARKSAGFPGVAGHEPDAREGRAAAARIDAAIAILRAATPGSGAYVNECDFFEPDWQASLYGVHYERLLAIKKRYDPGNLLRVHHGVGSDL
ncbi:MAG: FAD-binding protein [Acuticoccus sp.]